MGDMPTVLESIVTARRRHLADIQRRIAHVDPATLAPSTHSLYNSLGSRGEGRFIMECKSASPSLGPIRATSPAYTRDTLRAFRCCASQTASAGTTTI